MLSVCTVKFESILHSYVMGTVCPSRLCDDIFTERLHRKKCGTNIKRYKLTVSSKNVFWSSTETETRPRQSDIFVLTVTCRLSQMFCPSNKSTCDYWDVFFCHSSAGKHKEGRKKTSECIFAQKQDFRFFPLIFYITVALWLSFHSLECTYGMWVLCEVIWDQHSYAACSYTFQ